MLAELYNMNRTLLGLIITVFIFRRQYVSSDHLCGLATLKVMKGGGEEDGSVSEVSWKSGKTGVFGKKILLKFCLETQSSAPYLEFNILTVKHGGCNIMSWGSFFIIRDWF